MTTIVVVGASLAGVHAAAAIRKSGFDQEVIVVGRELHRPYDRPPLSKEFLTGGGDETRLPLPAAAEDRLNVSWFLGREALQLDADSRSLHLSDGSSLDFDGLVVATGALARLLPASVALAPTDGIGPDDSHSTEPWSAAGVVTLRSLDDARRLRRLLADGASTVVVCGAGFIGVEVAASARQMGADVTIVDVASAPLSRVLDESVGNALSGFLEGRGIKMLMGQSVDVVETAAGSVSSVVLSSGQRLDADVLVVGIGAVPDTAWLVGSGLDVGTAPGEGLLVDEFCRAHEGIVGAGDVASWPNQLFGGRRMRVEQWDNAVEMGQYAGRSLIASMQNADPDEPYQPVPWFWSDQFDRKIQLAGITSTDWHDTVGTPVDDRFVRAYFDAEKLCGVLAWNRPRQAIIGRQLIAGGATRSEAVEKLTPKPT